MRFLTLLKSGVSVEIVAQNYVLELLRKSWPFNTIDLEFACDFVHDILTAIGLTCEITPEQINNGFAFVWPMEQINIYSFHYNKVDFTELEKFLLLMCSHIDIHTEIFLEQPVGSEADDQESPVIFLMELMAVWCVVCRQLIGLEELQSFKRFEEPFARINYQLLLGIHDMRIKYRSILSSLDKVCNRLYNSAVQGLFYKECHDMIFTGLLRIISKDYDLFLESSAECTYFFYEAFSVDINSSTHLTIYKELKDILLKTEVASNEDDGDDFVAINTSKLNTLTNVLIKPFMLEVYFTTLAQKNKGKINTNTQQEALKFLNILQSKLPTLDCFSRAFMEVILNMIFKTDSTTSSLASTLYINMMKRKFPERILKHIIDFYATHFDSIAYLKSCILNMYESFHSEFSFKNFLEIITDTNTEDIIRFLSAHMLVAVFEIKVNENDSASKQEIKELLEIVLELFENLQCQSTIGILMKVFTQIPIQNLSKPIIDNFIHNAIRVFTDVEIIWDYPLLMNMFNIFHKFLDFNHEWHYLELVTDQLTVFHQEMIKELKIIEETENMDMFTRKLPLYNGFVKRLNICLKAKYDLFDILLFEILKNFAKYFLFNELLQNVITAEKSFIGIYALEICLSCIMKLSSKLTEITQNDSIITELSHYVLSHIQNMDNLLKLPVMHIKTYFASLLQLCTYLPHIFDSNIYHQLIQILINVNFKNKSFNRKLGDELLQLHPMQSIGYQRLMFKQFAEMHKFPRVAFNTNMVWKVCIYYGMPKHTFNEELKHLLITLATYRLQIYKNIISVLIYNLYKQNPALKPNTIKSIIKKHKHLIDNDIQLESPVLLKIHVVLLILQINEKALTVQRIKGGHNRLEAFKDLNIFIEDLDLSQLQAKELMEEQLSNYQKHLLTNEEYQYFNQFKHFINREVSANEKFEISSSPYSIKTLLFFYLTRGNDKHRIQRLVPDILVEVAENNLSSCKMSNTLHT